MPYSNQENQRTSAPYGDVYFMPTSRVDRFVQNHEADERRDQLIREKEVGDMDKELSSHLGNVLNPDVADIVNSWQDYRPLKKRLLFDQKLQKDPIAYAQVQVEANKKLAAVMQLISDSTQRKKTLGEQLQSYYKTPQKMEDNFTDRFNLSLNTPTTLARQHPEYDNHYWAGPDEDFTKTFNDAKGKPRFLRSIKTPMGKDAEQLAVTNVWGTNDPATFMGSLNAKNADRKHSMMAKKVLDNMTPEEIQQINEHYAQLSKDKFENWGMKDKPSLEPTDPNNPAEILHSIQAKAYALNAVNTFDSREGKPEVNTEVRRKLNEESKLRLQNARLNQQLANSKSLALFKKQNGIGTGKGKDDEDYKDPIEPILQKWEDEAKAGGTGVYKTADGQQFTTQTVKAPEELKKALEVRAGVKVYHPDAVKIADNGDYLGVFYKKDPVTGESVKENGNYAIDPKIPTVRVSRDDVKINLGKQFLTKKSNQKLLENIGGGKPKKTKGELSVDDAKKQYGIDY